MAKLVFVLNQSLDGYVDHQAFAPDRLKPQCRSPLVRHALPVRYAFVGYAQDMRLPTRGPPPIRTACRARAPAPQWTGPSDAGAVGGLLDILSQKRPWW